MEIAHQLHINASAEKIYQAVATQAGVTSWWSKNCTVGESEGEASHLSFDKQGTIVKMGFKTEKLVPHQKVVWVCTHNPNPAWVDTTINTFITPTNEGCDVHFSHADFDKKWKGQDPFEMTKQGWEHFIASLVAYCEKGEGQPW